MQPMQSPANMTNEEWALRVNLAAAYRLVALFGWDDLVFTHLTARVPGPEHHFLINPLVSSTEKCVYARSVSAGQPSMQALSTTKTGIFPDLEKSANY